MGKKVRATHYLYEEQMLELEIRMLKLRTLPKRCMADKSEIMRYALDLMLEVPVEKMAAEMAMRFERGDA